MADWHEEYRKRYARLKEAGKSFFPHAVFKDSVVSFLVFCAIAFLAWRYGAELEPLADPTDSTYNPRPEWYFLFLFQALKSFPGEMEAVAAIILPGAAVLLLALVPFLDRGPERRPLKRPFWTGLGVLSLAAISYLTWAGYHSPMTNPVMEKDARVVSGQRLYRELKCSYCHKIGGKGGAVGPELDKVAGEEAEDWLTKHFRDPQAVTPGSTMPKLNLLEDEIADLVAYMKSLGPEPFTQEAPKLFTENCAACHRVGKEGGDVGPDLSLIGTARDKAYIKHYIQDPSKVVSTSSMPGYEGQLTEVQIEDLARYLSSLGRPQKAF